MNDQELDQLMRRVLLDAAAQNEQKENQTHVKDGEVLLTWHYTRTYLSDLFKYGDSGRQWGGDKKDGGVVVAEGTACDLDIWDLYVHHVYYGTED